MVMCCESEVTRVCVPGGWGDTFPAGWLSTKDVGMYGSAQIFVHERFVRGLLALTSPPSIRIAFTPESLPVVLIYSLKIYESGSGTTGPSLHGVPSVSLALVLMALPRLRHQRYSL